MLTAKDRVSDKVMGLESGADDYIVKPFETLSNSMARIKACLRLCLPAGGGPGVRSGSFRSIAKTLGSCASGGRKRRSDKERVRPAPSLRIEPGPTAEPLGVHQENGLEGFAKIYSWSRVIDVHIQHLRQKIEKNPLEPEYIITVPGVGYKFRE